MMPTLHEHVENFYVVGKEHQDGLNNFNFFVSRYGASNVFYASSFVDMVRKIRARCRMASPVIGDLVIQAHGNTGMIVIGQDMINGGNFSAFSAALSLLHRFVAPGFTHVKLEGCKTGADDSLIRAWSQFWLGTPVSAGVQIQWSGGRSLDEGFEGKVRTAFAGGVFETSGGP